MLLIDLLQDQETEKKTEGENLMSFICWWDKD